MIEEMKEMTGGAPPGEQAELTEEMAKTALPQVKGLVEPDYLAFLLDELVFERKWHREGGCLELLEKMIHEELDRWGLSEKAELELAGILAERHGSRITEPGAE